MLNAIDSKLLETIADFHETPQGAFNIRKNRAGVARQSTANIQIVPKDDKPGIDIIVKPGTKNESVHIPVLLTLTGINDLVYNTFEIGAMAEVLVVAGCGIHNPGEQKAQHDGIHEIFVRRGAKIRYVEKHYGEGTGTGARILNPKTIIYLEEGGIAELELVQIKGVDSTFRTTTAVLEKKAQLITVEKLLTHGKQKAESEMVIELRGEESSAQIISRSVAQDVSEQVFCPRLVAYNRGRGHVECDSIIMDGAKIRSVPEISAQHAEAELTHEAAIGKIAGEQLLKLMSLGLTEKEAVDAILHGFLR
jgi:Fe-S cluster assembly scaffold protein SufB